MYQLFAYGKKYKNNKLYLVYPKNEQTQPRVKYGYCTDGRLDLRVVYFDLERR